MNRSIGRKLWQGFLAIIIITLIVGGTGFYALTTLHKEYRYLIDDRLKNVILIEQLASLQNQNSNAIRGFLLYKSEIYRHTLETTQEKFDTVFQELDAIGNEDDAKEYLETIRSSKLVYDGYTESIIEKTRENENNEALRQANFAAQYHSTMENQFSALIELQEKERQNVEEQLVSLLKNVQILIISCVVIAFIIGIIVARRITRSIAMPVQKVTAAIEQLAAGNLAVDNITIKNKDEIGVMAQAFNNMKEDLRSIIGNTRDSSMQVAVHAEQLSASSEQSLAASEMVAETAERNLLASDSQLSIVTESVDAMNQMVNSIDSITQNNSEMLNASDDVTMLVQNGTKMMHEFVEQMNSIRTTFEQSVHTIQEMANHSEEIRQVTALITSIAEQTNLLALNAAIEAARAGEHGKGFAVVASEVRSLAEQSKHSAEEIGQMIDAMIEQVTGAVKSTEDGNRKVADGVVITEKTNFVFQQIETSTTTMKQTIDLVASAIQQLRTDTMVVTSGAEQVQELANQTSAEAQSTSAATEEQLAANQEISASSQTLAELAEKLQQDVARFTI